MYTVLIVDDEVHAIRGLEAGVRWDRLNINAVHTARGLKQAQHIFQTEPVQLMLCDIEMPKGSGLDLLAWVREYYPKTETIFLTSHSDFSYAKKAIQLGSFEYLLKPVDYEELEQVIDKALAKINKDLELSAFESNYKHYVQLWESQKPMLKERFWQELLRQSIVSSPESTLEYAAKYKLPYLGSTKFLPILFRVQKWYKSLNQRDEQIMEYALRNAAEEQVLRFHSDSAVVSIQSGGLLVLFPAESESQDIAMLADCEAYVRSCSQYFNCELSAYIGQPVHAYKMVDQYQQLTRMDQDNVTHANQTLLLRDYRKNEQTVKPPSMNEWAEWMKQGAKEKLTGDVARYLDELKEAKNGVDAQSLQLFYQNFLQMMFFVLQVKGLQANEVFASNLLTDKPEAVLRSLSSMKEWILYLVEVAMNRIHALQENLSLVEKVKRFINEHIGEQSLTREEVANFVYLNPDYLNRVFKKEEGMSISDYVQLQRIEYAKQLLTRSEYSVSDIAVQSGYSNLSYFSTLFKKMTGMNPGDYRKLAQSK
ncbi:MAG TPA: helix-turn-helix domain-containing protein [Candidatus Udaeobacter sp.]|nr:helix-turn-helix domain-containing protein [Candidatus Udaeobacter sp.]